MVGAGALRGGRGGPFKPLLPLMSVATVHTCCLHHTDARTTEAEGRGGARRGRVLDGVSPPESSVEPAATERMWLAPTSPLLHCGILQGGRFMTCSVWPVSPPSTT
jgi:hypothetical protein